MIFLETLVYVIQNNKVLLILKKKGLGKGYYNGIGGKVEKGEDIIDAAIRECREEVGIIPKNLEWRALLEFWNFENRMAESVHFVHVFVANSFEGEPRETEEAKPFWFDIENVPYDKMWEDDILWLPRVLKGERLYGRFYFENWKLKKSEVMKVSGLG